MQIDNSKKIYRGSGELARVYRGQTIVWEPYFDPRESEYLTTEILSGGTIKIGEIYNTPHLYYRKNGGDWTALYSQYIDPSWVDPKLEVSDGDIVEWKRDYSGQTTIDFNDVYFNVRGNIMSLEYGDDFIGKKTIRASGYAFYRQFWHMNVVSAADLVLPATKLKSWCYSSMFQGCTSLTAAPDSLPKFERAGDNACQNVYSEMFKDCTSLTVAPVISPLSPYYKYACDEMFRGSSVSYVKCLAVFEGSLAGNAFANWLADVPSGGTFVKSPLMDQSLGPYYWPRNARGIPSSWTVVDG